MWIVKISGVESSGHTQQIDADAQKARLITNGTPEGNITIVEQETFNPPPMPVGE